MKNILVVGGSYFVGRVLVEELIKKSEYNVFVFNRGRIPLKLKGVTEIVGDREDEDHIRTAIPEREWHVLIDFCAYTPGHIQKMINSLPGTLNHYIFISTTTVYKNIRNIPIKEDAPKLSTRQPELGPYADYGIDKWRAEQKLREMCEERGIRFTTMRPAFVYGKYNYAPRESYFFDLLREDKPIIIPDNGLALFSFVWVEDIAKIIIRSLGNEKVFDEVFNLSSEELVSYPRLVEVLEEVSEKSIEPMKMSVKEIDEKRIPLPFPLDSHFVYSGSKIQRVLDFEYTPFEDGLRETYGFYQRLQERKRQLADRTKSDNA